MGHLCWNDIEWDTCLETKLTLRLSALVTVQYTPKADVTLKAALMNMEERGRVISTTTVKGNPKIRGPLKVLQHVFIGKLNIKGHKAIRGLMVKGKPFK